MNPKEFFPGGGQRSSASLRLPNAPERSASGIICSSEKAKVLVDIVHEYGKKAYVFYDDSWVGLEPYGKPLLSDAFEAVIGAMFLDGGFAAAERFVRRFVMDPMTGRPVYSDSKTRLQERVQGQQADSIEYELISEEGPEHDKIFTVEVRISGTVYGTGSGHSKKLAEQTAAAEALSRLEKETED